MNASSEFSEDDRLHSDGVDGVTADESEQSSNSGGRRETLLSKYH